MKRTRLFNLLVVILVVAIFFSGCGQGKTPDEDAGKPNTSGEASNDESVESSEDELEPYTFTHYFNYDYWDIKPWDEDEVSKALKEKFNVHVEFAKPDSDPEARLNVMVSAGDLPDSIMMDRGPTNIKLAQLELLHPLEPLMENNSSLEENLLPETIELLKIDDELYGIPNWARKEATGGNEMWIYNKRLYEAAGNPKLETLDDLFNFAKTVKEEVPETEEGLPTVPFTSDSNTNGWQVAKAFYRSFGGVNNGWYAVIDDKYQLVFRDPMFKQASLEINKWWREGLMSETQFTDNEDQILEKMVEGRTALAYYDMSKDETNKFRKILIENHPDDSYEPVMPFPYPPADGLSTSDIYADFQATVGWNVTCISKEAENPQRIFDLWSYFLTPEAALLQMYGPQGDFWDELDDEGLPILKKPESELTSEEINRLGLWFWMMPGQSDNIDSMKFAVEEKLPSEQQAWHIKIQREILTPLMWLTDEFVGIADVIDPQNDEGINRTLCEDHIAEEYPKMLMAKSQEEAERIYQGIIDFCDENGMSEIEEIYDKKYRDNVEIVGTGLNK